MIASSWPMAALTSVAPLVNDRVTFFEGMRPYVATAGVDVMQLLNSTRVSFDHRPSRADMSVIVGDVACARMRDTNKVLEITQDYRHFILSTGFAIFRPGTKILTSYLRYWLVSPFFNTMKDLFCTGTTQKAINNTAISQLKVPLPPLEQQKNIVRILDEVESLRKLRAQTDRRTAGLILAIFYDIFGDVVENSKDWPKMRFRETCESRLGKMLDAKQQTGKHRRPYLRNTNVQWNHFDLSNLLEMDFSENERDTFRLRCGDILICEGGEVGRSAIWRDDLPECYFQKALHRVRPNPELITPEYIVHMLWFFARKGGFKEHISTATIAHLTGVRLKNMQIPVPPLSLQRKFASRVAEVRKLEVKQAVSRKRLDNLFQSLLYLSFKGELISTKADEQAIAITPYKDDAAVVCLLLAEMKKFQRPTTEFFIQKHIFVTKHYLHLPVNSVFKRKVAGPWSQELRWKAIEAAIKMNWLRWEKSRLAAGPAFEKALSHAAFVLGDGAAQITQLVDDLKSFGSKGLERWTTVLKVVEDLKEQGQPITQNNIQREIDNWPEKRLKEIFAEESVDHTIAMMLKHNWLPTTAGQ